MRMQYFGQFLLLALFMSANAVKLGVMDPSTKKYCIVFQADINGTVNYQDEAGTTRTSTFSVPDGSPTRTSTKADQPSHCGKSEQQLTIEFVPEGFNHSELEADHLWYLSLKFGSSGSMDQGQYTLANYSLNVMFFESQNASKQYNDTYTYTKAPTFKPEWSATLQQGTPNGFACSKNALFLSNKTSLTFENLKFVAFAAEPKAEFREGLIFEQCLLDMRTSDLIPIIVGACLAGLVIIVLIAYLIGRARAKRQGYASV